MLRKVFLNERIILGVILCNALVMFFLAFEDLSDNVYLDILDHFFTLFFAFEVSVKIGLLSWRVYINDKWNVFDFVITLVSLPSLLLLVFKDLPDLSALLVFRVVRVAKFFRFLRFIPHIQDLIKGTQRAIKASIFVFIVLFVYIFILSLFSCFLFRSTCPEHFSNPIDAFYSIFRIFTVEGWYEIPDKISERSSFLTSILVKLYFVLVVLTGGIFGFSIVNAIFVDEMVRDNNDNLEAQVKELHKKIDLLLNERNSN
ncbi:MAG: ion transporter [Bacteroidia bacterium]|nr:ion transporter [Bacteroidia bacterium]MDW8346673.1 ion transporter [Bacteroidia bacterium]